MLVSTISAALLLAVSSNAMPWPGKPNTYTPSGRLDKVAKLFPQSALPAPEGHLKYVLLGVGTQNYTCATSDDTTVPGTTGAVAVLYDIGTKLNNDKLAKWKIPTISPLALSLSFNPKIMNWNLQSQGYEHVAGHHFFSSINAANTPVFALDQLQPLPFPIAKVGRINGTDAPSTACPSSDGLPAIQWLYLKDTKGLSQGGIDTVYRVETAGGNKPATCKGMKPTWEVKYAAQYWIYGPKF
ncbi:hypothetical protein ACN47E_007390 [Coniothyrium glycines]